jgi:hypothetical protein
MPRILLPLAVTAVLAILPGCYRTPDSVRHVPASDLKSQHPACFQQPNGKPPKAFLIKSEAALKQVWGPGEDAPVVNFEKNILFVAFTSLSSEGPGTLEVWALQYRELEDVMEVKVKEDVGGSWPLSTGFSRAYDIVKLPRTSKPVRVSWKYQWGAQNQDKELKAEEWVPQAGDSSSGGTWSGQGGSGSSGGGWSGAVQPGSSGQGSQFGRWPTAAEQPR